MLKDLYDEIILQLDNLYTLAAVHSETGDAELYRRELVKLVKIAEVLDIDTTLTVISINLKNTGEDDK